MSKTTLICFANELSVREDGWAMLAPFGSFPGVATQPIAGGGVKRYDAVQVVDRESAVELVNEFNSFGGKIRRFLRGVPIFVGHPDMPGRSHLYPHKEPVGTTVELQVRDDGLWCKPCFTNDGLEYIDANQGLGFSARWSGNEAGEQDGKPVYRPASLKSIGLTQRPNLPVELINDDEPPGQPQDIMKEQVLAWLKGLGIELANDASNEQITSALTQVAERAGSAVTLANEKTILVQERDTARTEAETLRTQLGALSTERDAARTEFANERKDRIEKELDLAEQAGRITPAQRPEWASKLTANFTNEAPALAKLAPALKTQSQIGDVTQRKAELGNCQDFRAVVTHFTAAGKTKAEAVREAIVAAPELYNEYRRTGGEL
jgi:hypothetical protein